MGDGTLTGGLDAMPLIVSNAVNSVAIFALIPVPLFIIMGELFFHTGLAVRVFDALDRCFGRLPGRLSYITVAGGTVATLWLDHGEYRNDGLAYGPRNDKKEDTKGTCPWAQSSEREVLAMIIPPSAHAGPLGEPPQGIDIGGLLIAGVIPGLILTVLYSILIFGQVKLDPDAAPEYSVRHSPFKEIIWSLIVNVLPMGFIVFCVIRLIILGMSHPDRAAGFGAFGVVILGILFRVMTWDVLVKSFAGALQRLLRWFYSSSSPPPRLVSYWHSLAQVLA